MCLVSVAFLSQEGHVSEVGRTLSMGVASEARLGAWALWKAEGSAGWGHGPGSPLQGLLGGSELETSIQNPNMMDEINRMVGKEGQKSQVTVFIPCLL